MIGVIRKEQQQLNTIHVGSCKLDGDFYISQES